MGIYIAGIKMPSGCGECNHLDAWGRDIKCRATSRQESEIEIPRMHDFDNYRPEWCPLTEVEEPHGRLIDVDGLIEFIENRYDITWESDCYEGGIKDACTDIIEEINSMPTILEAEGAEE